MRLSGALLLACSAQAGWLGGVAEVKITPAPGVRMAGFSARKAPAQGVHDDIFVRALALTTGRDSLALVTCDLIGVEKKLVDEIRSEAEKATGIPAARILVAATHTHSGPVVEGDYRSFFAAAAVRAIAEAWREKQPVAIGAGKTVHRGWVGMNRRRLESGFSPVDKEIPILKICDSGGRIQALLYNYSCHAACLGPDNLAISADWPYFVRERIRSKLGAQVKVLFFQGTEGNVNTGYSAGLSAIGVPIATRNWSYAAEIGERLADAIVSKAREIEVRADGRLEVRQESVPLETYIPNTLEQAEAQAAEARNRVAALRKAAAPAVHLQAALVNEAFAGMALSRTRRNLAAKQRRYAAELQVMRVGDAAFVSFPGEFFVEIGLAVKGRSPFGTTFCLGLANDGIGYLPTDEAFAEGGYEVSVARFGPGSARAWEEAAGRLLVALR